jgi:hypothetical protein
MTTTDNSLPARVDRYIAVLNGSARVADVPACDLPVWERYRAATADAIRAKVRPCAAQVFHGWERRARRIAEAHAAEECCL